MKTHVRRPVLHFWENAMVPQIPLVEDVLYALHLTPQYDTYWFAFANCEVYVANTHLVAAQVMCERSGDASIEDDARLAAELIMAMSPVDAHVTTGYEKAMKELARLRAVSST